MWYVLSKTNSFGYRTHQIEVHTLFHIHIHETGNGYMAELVERRLLHKNRTHFSFVSEKGLVRVVDKAMDSTYHVLLRSFDINEIRWSQLCETIRNTAVRMIAEDIDLRFNQLRTLIASIDDQNRLIILNWLYRIVNSDKILDPREEEFLLHVAQQMNSSITNMEHFKVLNHLLDDQPEQSLNAVNFTSEQIELLVELMYLATFVDLKATEDEMFEVNAILIELGVDWPQAEEAMSRVISYYRRSQL